jgi:hypothetical protein
MILNDDSKGLRGRGSSIIVFDGNKYTLSIYLKDSAKQEKHRG